MKAEELYKQKIIAESNNVSLVILQFQEFDDCYTHNNYNRDIISDKITIKTHAYDFEDERRFWILCSVWYEGKPFMITQNAGREGEDFVRRFVTDKVVYKEAFKHIVDLIPFHFEDVKDDEDFYTFYHNAL